MEAKNLILGGGISGLICLHYIKDSVMFEANSTLAKDFLDTSFPKYIHKSDLTMSLCEELGVIPKLKEFKIGILFEEDILDFFDQSMDEEKKSNIYIKYCGKKYKKYVEGKMNGFLNKNHSREYIENKKEIIDRMSEAYKDRIFLDCRANEINLKTKRIRFNGDLFAKIFNAYYENLISTIPISVFMHRASLDGKIRKKTFEVATFHCIDHKLKNYNFVYVVDSKYDFNRIAIDGDFIIFERNESESDFSDCLKFLEEEKIEYGEFSFKKFSFSTCKTLEVPNVRFIGRFSTGNYTQKIDEVINEARQIG